MNFQKTIFISAYRDFAIRYLLYSDVFHNLRSQPYRIIIFLKDNDIKFYRDRFDYPNVVLEPVFYHKALGQLRRSRLSSFFVLVRKCMSGTAPGYRNTTDDVRRYQYSQEMSGRISRKVRFQLARLLSRIGSRVRVIRELIVKLESWNFPGRMYDQYFEKYHPDMLIVTSLGHMIDPLFMRAASRHGASVVAIMRNFDAPTTKDYRGAHIDHVVAWNPIMEKEVRIFHDLPRERIHVGGIAHWDFYFNGQYKVREKPFFLKENRLSKDRKIIFYATSGFKLFSRSFDVIIQLLSAAENNRFRDPVQFLVRLHPAYLSKNNTGEGQVIDRYRKQMADIERRYPNLVSFVPPDMRFLTDGIDTPVEDMYKLADTFTHADILLNEYSTVMIESTIFDLPIINVGLYNYRDTEKPISYLENFTHIKRLLKSGASKNAYTFDQLVTYINDYLEDPAKDRQARKCLFAQEINTHIGEAGSATAAILRKLINE